MPIPCYEVPHAFVVAVCIDDLKSNFFMGFQGAGVVDGYLCDEEGVLGGEMFLMKFVELLYDALAAVVDVDADLSHDIE